MTLPQTVHDGTSCGLLKDTTETGRGERAGTEFTELRGAPHESRDDTQPTDERYAPKVQRERGYTPKHTERSNRVTRPE